MLGHCVPSSVPPRGAELWLLASPNRLLNALRSCLLSAALQLLGFVHAEGEQALPRHYYMTVRGCGWVGWNCMRGGRPAQALSSPWHGVQSGKAMWWALPLQHGFLPQILQHQKRSAASYHTPT